MLAKKMQESNTFITAVNFVGILAVITVFRTEESTPGHNSLAIGCMQTGVAKTSLNIYLTAIILMSHHVVPCEQS
jgi:hypothetical protein